MWIKFTYRKRLFSWRLLHTSNIVFKNVPPLWFLAPRTATSWSKGDIFKLLHHDNRLNKMKFANSSIGGNSNFRVLFLLMNETVKYTGKNLSLYIAWLNETIFKLMWWLRVQSPVCYRLSSVYTVSTIFPEQDFSVWAISVWTIWSRDVSVWWHFGHDFSVHK